MRLRVTKNGMDDLNDRKKDLKAALRDTLRKISSNSALRNELLVAIEPAHRKTVWKFWDRPVKLAYESTDKGDAAADEGDVRVIDRPGLSKTTYEQVVADGLFFLIRWLVGKLSLKESVCSRKRGEECRTISHFAVSESIYNVEDFVLQFFNQVDRGVVRRYWQVVSVQPITSLVPCIFVKEDVNGNIIISVRFA